jgi:hypothetical protein
VPIRAVIDAYDANRANVNGHYSQATFSGISWYDSVTEFKAVKLRIGPCPIGAKR